MEISDWRIKIDALEDQIIKLLNERASYAVEIGKIKKEKGLPVFDKSREQAILDRVAKKCEAMGGPLYPESMKNIFEVLMRETCKIEE